MQHARRRNCKITKLEQVQLFNSPPIRLIIMSARIPGVLRSTTRQPLAIRLRASDLAWPSRGQRSRSRCPRPSGHEHWRRVDEPFDDDDRLITG